MAVIFIMFIKTQTFAQFTGYFTGRYSILSFNFLIGLARKRVSSNEDLVRNLETQVTADET
jgi:hypothetical protein